MAYKTLTEYNFPQDLKTMSLEEMDRLCGDIREFLVEKVSKTGGHLASNLGVVELTVALHKYYKTPKDKIVWDVGHQTYVHKILTGRAGISIRCALTAAYRASQRWRRASTTSSTWGTAALPYPLRRGLRQQETCAAKTMR